MDHHYIFSVCYVVFPVCSVFLRRGGAEAGNTHVKWHYLKFTAEKRDLVTTSWSY